VQPKGGLARRAGAIRAERDANDHVLLVDAGSSLLGGYEKDYEAKALLMVGAMNRMGYNALTVGQGELRLGSRVLLKIMQEADYPFLSANLTAGEGGALLAQPYTLLQLDHRRAAVIGVTAPEDTDLDRLEENEVGVLDPIESVRRQVDAVKAQAQVIIVLSHLGLEMDQRLAREVRGIDLIVGGRSGGELEEPIHHETAGTVIVQTRSRGESLGIIDLELDQQGRIVSYDGRSLVLDDTIAEDAELAAWLQSVQPTPTPRPSQ